jgi:hypothetical protein
MHVQVMVNSMLENHNQLHTTFEHVQEQSMPRRRRRAEVEHVELVFRKIGTQRAHPLQQDGQLGGSQRRARARYQPSEAASGQTARERQAWAGKSPPFEES